MTAREALYGSWGSGLAGRVAHAADTPADLAAACKAYLAAGEHGSVLGRGCGRSYGDVALNAGGTLVDCTALDRFIDFDPESGLLTCEAGVRLADILAVVCRPEADGAGWFLPVSPGTRYVSVAGAVANDVHGKNHHLMGTFGCHVRSVDLLRSDGTVRHCSREENADLFAATVGGLGLTGLILRVTLQMRRVDGLGVEMEDIRFDRLDEFFEIAAESDADWEYTAAWVDCLAGGDAMGRGIFSRARHKAGVTANPPSLDTRLSVPAYPPLSLVGGPGLKAFNALYWRKLFGKRKLSVGSYEPVHYPLDAIGDWNRLYGPRGFYQFQCAVPMETARDVVGEMLSHIAAAGEGSMLAVLKVFGDVPSPGLLSFPMPGVTLALDFPNRGERSHALLRRLEDMTVTAGGRLYPAKDSLMSAATFQAGYPNIEAFRAQMDPAASSSFARRVGLIDPAETIAETNPEVIHG